VHGIASPTKCPTQRRGGSLIPSTHQRHRLASPLGSAGASSGLTLPPVVWCHWLPCVLAWGGGPLLLGVHARTCERRRPTGQGAASQAGSLIGGSWAKRRRHGSGAAFGGGGWDADAIRIRKPPLNCHIKIFITEENSYFTSGASDYTTDDWMQHDTECGIFFIRSTSLIFRQAPDIRYRALTIFFEFPGQHRIRRRATNNRIKIRQY